MKAAHLAVVVPIDPAEQNDSTIRETVWQKTTELLLPHLGKFYTRFEPAEKAWKQRVDRPFGVIVGKSDPALFLYYYAAAKAYQQDAIKFHLAGALNGFDPNVKYESENLVICSMEVKGDGASLAAHMGWHIGMIGGEFFPDCGVYYLDKKRSMLDEAQDAEVLKNLEKYALCVVTLAMEANV